MLCEKCKVREANIKYTEIINGVKTEHNLCSHCAKEMDFGQYTALLDGEFPLGKLLSGLLGLEEDEEETDERFRVVCPTCGTSFDDFCPEQSFRLSGSAMVCLICLSAIRSNSFREARAIVARCLRSWQEKKKVLLETGKKCLRMFCWKQEKKR